MVTIIIGVSRVIDYEMAEMSVDIPPFPEWNSGHYIEIPGEGIVFTGEKGDDGSRCYSGVIALEFGVLKDWKENPVKEFPDIDESVHPFHVCYGGYLLNPDVSDSDISRKIKDQTGFWLAAIDDTRMDCHSIAYYDIHTLPLISCGHQKIVPFAALIKAESGAWWIKI